MREHIKGPMSQPPALIWFRQDLRLADHPALAAALASGRKVLAAYVLDDDSPGPWAMGGAARWWLHHSLAALDRSLRDRGASLVLRRGPAPQVIASLVQETGAAEIHAGRMHEPWARRMDAAVQARIGQVKLHLHRTATLLDLDAIRTKAGGVYGVYTPFAKACRPIAALHEPIPAPETMPAAQLPQSDRLEDWGLLPKHPDWAGGLRATWQPGEQAALTRLAAFAQGAVQGYGQGRNLPGEPGTSRLSAHLHWGEISPRQVWHATSSQAASEGVSLFQGELLWREFAAYLLFHHPHLPEQPLRPSFAGMEFRHAPADLRAWQRGRTGIPIVDAGMRQLWHTGWMHNRVRMIAASFLVKQLLIDWREGEHWFWDTLVDADLASNAASWQWIAGCGIDSQPYFRVFNPVTQGQRWDGAGAYVRRWVPELADVPDSSIHAPWAASVKPTGYPAPIVDLAQARARALERYRAALGRDAA